MSDRPRMPNAGDVAVAVAKPQLPAADELLPYLREIDRARRYANGGQLVRRFEARVADRIAGGDDAVVLVSSGTAALVAIFAALQIEPGTLCLMPAWTFAATAHAAVAAGLVPYLVDVDPVDGVLTPELAFSVVANASAPVGAVVAVAPFGQPVSTDGWIAFRERTGIPVVLDAAAGFDTICASPIPTAVSLHATKTLGIGEGGLVVWSSAAGVRAVRERINFGFAGRREAMSAATNAKPSEYAAAVGLAALDSWAAIRADFARVARNYRGALRDRAEISFQRGFGERWISSTVIVRVPAGTLAHAEDALHARGIETRRWWGSGLATQFAFRSFPRMLLPHTKALAATTLGLPCARDLASDTIAEIAEIVGDACSSDGRKRVGWA